MSETIFVEWFEIPFRIYAEEQKAEIATRTYPGHPASMEINKIEVAGDELEGLFQPKPFIGGTLQDVLNHVLKKHAYELEDAAWEHKE